MTIIISILAALGRIFVQLITSVCSIKTPMKTTVSHPAAALEVTPSLTRMTRSSAMKDLGFVLCFGVLLCAGCTITLGPQIERNTVVLRPGTPVEILKNVSVPGRPISKEVKDGEYPEITVDVGGWIAMDPLHWDIFKKQHNELRAAYKAVCIKYGHTLTTEDLLLLGEMESEP